MHRLASERNISFWTGILKSWEGPQSFECLTSPTCKPSRQHSRNSGKTQYYVPTQARLTPICMRRCALVVQKLNCTLLCGYMHLHTTFVTVQARMVSATRSRRPGGQLSSAIAPRSVDLMPYTLRVHMSVWRCEHIVVMA